MIEKIFINPATTKQWRIEMDDLTIRTCLNGGKVKEILCDSSFQAKSKAASAMMGQMRKSQTLLLAKLSATDILEKTETVLCLLLLLLQEMIFSLLES